MQNTYAHKQILKNSKNRLGRKNVFLATRFITLEPNHYRRTQKTTHWQVLDL